MCEVVIALVSYTVSGDLSDILSMVQKIWFIPLYVAGIEVVWKIYSLYGSKWGAENHYRIPFLEVFNSSLEDRHLTGQNPTMQHFNNHRSCNST